ncbi:hypothetical protein P879_02525 [Paragonimus westermani]|uniref:G-protein coupled receptors family 1 profile domain-containing protein n=1 Tax=Paragonimus westermani TaxID=34504 RepID=A0A8T0DTG3_9TREM|nr:hypothetical protein P879_02525 [Paragonimus westermani]
MNSSSFAPVESMFETRYGWLHFWVTLSLLGTLILCTVIGNVFVVAAILLEKHLQIQVKTGKFGNNTIGTAYKVIVAIFIQGVSNYLIVSLAVADLMVATLPMPIAVINEVSEDWWLGDALCDFWVCSDVLCCTASILHLVGIALDRYWAVTNAEYIRRRTARRIGIMIAIFWLLSLAISMPARFDYVRLSSWIKPTNLSLLSTEIVNCVINEEYGYTIFSNVGAFYMPMLFMIGIYVRIYQVARARIRRSRFRKHPNSTDVQSDCNFNASYPCHRVGQLFIRYCHNCCLLGSEQRQRSPHGVAECITKTTRYQTGSVDWDKSHNPHEKIKTRSSTNNKEDGSLCRIQRFFHNFGQADHSPEGKAAFAVLNCKPNAMTDGLEATKSPGGLSLKNETTLNYNFLPTMNPSLRAFVPDASSDKANDLYRRFWNGVSHSAPASTYNIDRLIAVSNSTSNANDTYSTQSERSELADISSSNSALHSVTKLKPKWTANGNKQKNGLYAMFRTLMLRKSYSGQSSSKWNTTANNSKPSNIAVATVHTRGSHAGSAVNDKRGYQNDDQAPQKSPKTPINTEPPTRSFVISCGSDDANSTHLRLEIKENTEPKAGRSTIDNKIIDKDDNSTDSIAVDNPMKSTHSELTNLATATAALKRERLENKRERKAAVTLAIITGCFMLCWLPFFIEALLTPFYPELRASRVVRSILLWLGYSNSLLNPIIYTIFSPDFRDAFRKILFGRYYHRSRER